jgi:O-antigen ligase
LNPFDVVVIPCLFVALLQNVFPYAAAAALGPMALRGFAARVLQGFRLGKTEWAIVACVGYWVASYFWSGGSLHNWTEILFWRRDGLLLITYPMFFLLLAWPLRPKWLAAVWVVFVTILGLAGIVGVILSLRLPHPMILESLGFVNYEPSLGQELFLAWYLAHNTTGAIYAIASLLALALLQERSGKKYQTLVWFLLVACMGGLAFAYSRGAYLGFVAGAAAILPLQKAGRTLKIGLLAVIPMLLLVLFTSSVITRIETITDPYYGNNVDRITLWREALGDFQSSPLIGIGFSRFNDEFLTFKGVKGLVWIGVQGQVNNTDSHAHNSYLQFLAEGGIAGLLVTMSVWWFAWQELGFFERKFPKSKLRWMHRGSKGCLVAVLVMSVTEHMLGEGTVVLSLMSVVGMTLAASRSELASLRSRHFQAGAARAEKSAVPVGQGSVPVGVGGLRPGG